MIVAICAEVRPANAVVEIASKRSELIAAKLSAPSAPTWAEFNAPNWDSVRAFAPSVSNLDIWRVVNPLTADSVRAARPSVAKALSAAVPSAST